MSKLFFRIRNLVASADLGSLCFVLLQDVLQFYNVNLIKSKETGLQFNEHMLNVATEKRSR